MSEPTTDQPTPDLSVPATDPTDSTPPAPTIPTTDTPSQEPGQSLTADDVNALIAQQMDGLKSFLADTLKNQPATTVPEVFTTEDGTEVKDPTAPADEEGPTLLADGRLVSYVSDDLGTRLEVEAPNGTLHRTYYGDGAEDQAKADMATVVHLHELRLI